MTQVLLVGNRTPPRGNETPTEKPEPQLWKGCGWNRELCGDVFPCLIVTPLPGSPSPSVSGYSGFLILRIAFLSGRIHDLQLIAEICLQLFDIVF